MRGKKKIAIVTGGLNEERDISLLSAAYIKSNLDQEKYEGYTLYMDGPDWTHHESGNRVDKNDFSMVLEEKRIVFDAVVLMIHGDPAENGKVQGYFELLGIPYTGCDTLVSALTFDKQLCKDVLLKHDIPLPDSFVLSKGQEIPEAEMEKIRFPVFIKPNCGGSSVGASKVVRREDVQGAINDALRFDHQVIVEEFMEGPELSCGVIEKDGKLVVFPITEIIPENEFFDYEAKYLGKSLEITPAELPKELSEKCKRLSARIYRILRCRGVVRFDYILKDETFYLLEPNTIPGLSPESIVPQQARAHGWTDRQLVEAIVSTAISNP